MVRRQVRAARQTLGQHWRVLVLVAVLVLLAAGYAVGTHTATSMNITVWTQYDDLNNLSPDYSPPKTEIFDRTISNQPLVHDTEQQLASPFRTEAASTQPVICLQVTCLQVTVFWYQFSFATFGVVTQVYYGRIGFEGWTVTTWGIPLSAARADTATLYGHNLMTTLHKLTGMPLPS
jgi:hypothetical protein